MDVYCPKCGEPIDTYEFHEEVDARDDGSDYSEVAGEFRAKGCGALWGIGARCNPETTARPEVSVMYELLGDDMDGAAAMFDDLGLS